MTLPEWFLDQLGARGGLCQDCNGAAAVTFWRSLNGPALCASCRGLRLADLEVRPI